MRAAPRSGGHGASVAVWLLQQPRCCVWLSSRLVNLDGAREAACVLAWCVVHGAMQRRHIL